MKIEHNRNPDPQSNWQDHLLVLWEGEGSMALSAYGRLLGVKPQVVSHDALGIKRYYYTPGLLALTVQSTWPRSTSICQPDPDVGLTIVLPESQPWPHMSLMPEGWVLITYPDQAQIAIVVQITISKEAWLPKIMDTLWAQRIVDCDGVVERDEIADEVLNTIQELLK